MTLSVTDKSVLAVMAILPDEMVVASGCPNGLRRTLPWSASIARAARKKWSVTATVPAGRSPVHCITCSLAAAPLVVGDNVYVTGRGGQGQQFDDCYVLCFDLASPENSAGPVTSPAPNNAMAMYDMPGVDIFPTRYHIWPTPAAGST